YSSRRRHTISKRDWSSDVCSSDLHEHKKYQMIMQDTGLGYERSDDFILIHVISRTRTEEQVKAFYTNTAKALEEQCAIKSTDLMFSISPNNDEDWSFGEGKAQFLTGDL